MLCSVWSITKRVFGVLDSFFAAIRECLNKAVCFPSQFHNLRCMLFWVMKKHGSRAANAIAIY
jgi:hypothetical protein